jgi:hypothetical protein
MLGPENPALKNRHPKIQRQTRRGHPIALALRQQIPQRILVRHPLAQPNLLPPNLLQTHQLIRLAPTAQPVQKPHLDPPGQQPTGPEGRLLLPQAAEKRSEAHGAGPLKQQPHRHGSHQPVQHPQQLPTHPQNKPEPQQHNLPVGAQPRNSHLQRRLQRGVSAVE